MAVECKRLLLLGASGSIGSQTLDVVDDSKGKFDLVGFSVGNNYKIIPSLLEKYESVKYVYLIDKKEARYFNKQYKNNRIKFFSGKKGLVKLVKKTDFDMCVNALVGFVGLEPSVRVLKKNKILCLANKETLVSGGTLINKLLAKNKGKLYPIDSEHVALAKCLACCNPKDVKRLIITASGGALRDIPLEELRAVKAEEALKHPTWNMGKKITIDCATMINKGFEIIEAHYLYNYPLEKISVIMNDESLVHSLVELNDGSFIVDYGKPDMHKPIKWAMYEGKVKNDVINISSLDDLKDCHFHAYDPKRYPCMELAKKALIVGASKMIALNAADEVAVNRYLKNSIYFGEISYKIRGAMNRVKVIKNPSLRKIKKIDKKVRKGMK